MSSSPPAVVADRYRLIAPLGQGGMGRVWRAIDVVLHRDVAIKELVPPPGLTPGERQEMRERSLREARAIARLNNVNVVRVFDVLRTDADPWIVMEYVPSRSLQDALAAEGPFNPVRAAEIGLGVLGALRAAHRAGVVHRDVKPGNVLIGADGRVVLTDFGLATVPGDPNVTRTGLVLGSPAYIAPERAREGTAGPAADLWSLGATLYAAVEGASPFARPSAIATLAALATENPPPARNAGSLKPVLNGLLRKDPSHRINAEEAERLLNRAAGRRSKLAFPMSPTMRRPGGGRDRLGAMGPTGATPVVPGPRPPVVPARPVDPPGRTPLTGGRPAVGEGRPPVYVPGKAPVGRTDPDRPTRVDAPRLDATRVDTPPVKDDKTSKIFGTRDHSTTASSPPPGSPPVRPGATPANPPMHTSRGGPGSFTAADVAASRRRQAAPEHEQSLADATALVSRVDTPPADATTVVGGPPADATTVVRGPVADATTVVGGPPAEATTVVRGPVANPVEATTVVPAPQRLKKKATPPAETKQPEAGPAEAGPAEAKRPQVGPAQTKKPKAKPAGKKAQPEAQVAEPAMAPSTGSPAKSANAGAAVDTPTEPDSTETDKSEISDEDARRADRRDAEEPKKGEPQPVDALEEAPAAPRKADKPGKSPAAVRVPLTRPVPPIAEPEAEFAEPKAEFAQPEAEFAQPETAPGEPKAGPTEPATGADKAKAGPDKLTTGPGEPTAASGEPTSGPDQPAAGPSQPTAVPSKSTAGQDEPDSVTDDSTAYPGEDPDVLAPISPPISRSTRPAWRPMEVRPSARPGVTVFGTRLTYAQAGIGGAVLLVVVVLLIVLAVKAFAKDDAPSTRPTTGPTVAVKPTGAGPTGNGRPSNNASVAATSQAPTSSAPGGFVLPAGWRMYTQRATSSAPAFTIPIPNNAQIRGSQGVSMEFSWNNRLLIVDRTNSPQPDAYQDLKNKEAAGSKKRGYSRIGVAPVQYRDFDSAADWEYLYTTEKGNPQHVIRRNIRVDAHSAYMLSWYVSPQDWGPSQTQLQTLYQGFQPG